LPKRDRLFFLVLALAMCHCAATWSHKERVRIKGSDTMLMLAQNWAETYMSLHPGAAVYVEGGGSETGFAALARGEVDLCASSRPIKPEEVRLLAKAYNSVGMAHMLAKDALLVYVHAQHPMQNLTLAQVRSIFNGSIHNWSQVGGPDAPVRVFIRPPNSGTHLYFAEHVLDGDPYSRDAQVVPTNQAMVDAVRHDLHAIGYGGSAFARDVAICRINGVAATEEAILDGTYPLTRYLYLYTVNTPRGTIKRFLDWVLSEQGQLVVRNAGYYPIWR